MDANGRVEFVALTKEEIEELLAKAALTGATVAADAIEKAHRKEQKSEKDRRLHNTRLLLKNYRMLKESCSKSVYEKEHAKETTAEIMEYIMSTKASDGVIVNSIKASAERTSIIISHVDRMLDVYRIYCSKYGEKEKRQYKVIKAMYITKEHITVSELADRYHVSKVTIYDDLKIAEERLSALFFGIYGLRFS